MITKFSGSEEELSGGDEEIYGQVIFNLVDVEEMFTFHDGTLTQNRVDNTFRMLCYMADSTPLENTSRLSKTSGRILLAITAPPLHFGRLPSGRRR